MSQGKHGGRLVAERRLDSFAPGIFELDAVDGGQHVHAQRRHADLEDDPGLGQIRQGQILRRRAQRGQSAQDARGVLRRREFTTRR